MTETPNDPDAAPSQDADPNTLHDGDMPAPYPADTPGGADDSGSTDGDDETADLAADADRLSKEADGADSPG